MNINKSLWLFVGLAISQVPVGLKGGPNYVGNLQKQLDRNFHENIKRWMYKCLSNPGDKDCQTLRQYFIDVNSQWYLSENCMWAAQDALEEKFKKWGKHCSSIRNKSEQEKREQFNAPVNEAIRMVKNGESLSSVLEE